MSPEQQAASTLPAPPPHELPRQCACCGSVVAPEAWEGPSLRHWTIEGETLALIECGCGNTLSKRVA